MSVVIEETSAISPVPKAQAISKQATDKPKESISDLVDFSDLNSNDSRLLMQRIIGESLNDPDLTEYLANSKDI